MLDLLINYKDADILYSLFQILNNEFFDTYRWLTILSAESYNCILFL